MRDLRLLCVVKLRTKLFDDDLAVSECDSDILKKAVSELKAYLVSDKVGVTVLFDVDGKPYDFSIIDIKQYGRLFSKKDFLRLFRKLLMFFIMNETLRCV